MPLMAVDSKVFRSTFSVSILKNPLCDCACVLESEVYHLKLSKQFAPRTYTSTALLIIDIIEERFILQRWRSDKLNWTLLQHVDEREE